MTEKAAIRALKADPLALARAFAEKYHMGKEKDVGDVYAGIWDIYDSAVELYGTILPTIAKLKNPSPDDLLGEIIDLEMELKHIQDHARDAIRGLQHISETLSASAE